MTGCASCPVGCWIGIAATSAAARSFHGIETGKTATRTSARSAKGMEEGNAETSTTARSFHGIDVGRVETRTAARSAHGIEDGKEARKAMARSTDGEKTGATGYEIGCAFGAANVAGVTVVIGTAGDSFARAFLTALLTIAGETTALVSTPLPPIIRDNQLA